MSRHLSKFVVGLTAACSLGLFSSSAQGQLRVATVQEYVKASNTGVSDLFGGATAVDGDTFAVSATGEASGWPVNQLDNSFSAAGAVYVYDRSGEQWAQSAFLKAPNAQENDGFGVSMALDGDTLAVGASGEDGGFPGVVNNPVGNPALQDNSSSNSGAVYIFERTGGQWALSAYIKASNAGVQDLFGGSLDLHGDMLVVGARQESSNAQGPNGDQTNDLGPNSGAAYVFRRTASGWVQEAYLKASNAGDVDLFGSRVAASENRVAIAAVGEDSAGMGQDDLPSDDTAADSGAVYVFAYSGGVWTEDAYLKASNTDALDQFGTGMDLSGDTLVVGAINESSASTFDPSDNSSTFSGAAYVFQRGAQSWFQVAFLKAPNQDAFDRFGFDVAVNKNEVVVSSRLEASVQAGVTGSGQDNSVPGAGAAYYFKLLPSGWAFLDYIKSHSPGATDNFGSALALDDRWLIVGATQEDSQATGIGGDPSNQLAMNAGGAFLGASRSRVGSAA